MIRPSMEAYQPNEADFYTRVRQDNRMPLRVSRSLDSASSSSRAASSRMACLALAHACGRSCIHIRIHMSPRRVPNPQVWSPLNHRGSRFVHCAARAVRRAGRSLVTRDAAHRFDRRLLRSDVSSGEPCLPNAVARRRVSRGGSAREYRRGFAVHALYDPGDAYSSELGRTRRLPASFSRGLNMAA